MIVIALICLCAFGAITLMCIVFFRMRDITSESQEISKRLQFWLSEKSASGQFGDYAGEREDKDESFSRRVLIPLGEQVGKWMAEKVPYHKQSAIRKQLIKAGYREKKTLQIFYSLKICFAVLFACIALLVLSVVGKGLQYSFAITAVGGFIGYLFPNKFLGNKVIKRQTEIDRVLPDALDLLVICTEAGMGIDQSLLRVAANLGSKGKALAEEIILTNREMNLGQERIECWNNLGIRTGSEELKNLARIIIQSEKVGSSIATVLRSQTEFLRVRRRQKAEETAAKMTVKMMIPLAIFIFPCIMAVTIGPPILKLMTSFSSMGGAGS